MDCPKKIKRYLLPIQTYLLTRARQLTPLSSNLKNCAPLVVNFGTKFDTLIKSKDQRLNNNYC